MGDFLPMRRAAAEVVNEFVIIPSCNAQRAPGCVVER